MGHEKRVEKKRWKQTHVRAKQPKETPQHNCVAAIALTKQTHTHKAHFPFFACIYTFCFFDFFEFLFPFFTLVFFFFLC